MCDDCESQWKSPIEAQSFENALSDEFHDVRPASCDELRAANWSR